MFLIGTEVIDCEGLGRPTFGNCITLVPFPTEKVFLSAKSDITFWILLMCQARLTTMLEILAL